MPGAAVRSCMGCSRLSLTLSLSCVCAALGQSSNGSNTSNASNCSNGTNGTNGSNGSNSSNLSSCDTGPPPPPCLTDCCYGYIETEARLLCMEFTKYGTNEVRCDLWAGFAKEACLGACSSCKVVGKALFDQCVFTLQPFMQYEQARARCTEMRTDFESYRCPSACIDKIAMCGINPGFRKCNAICGNFNKCDTYQNRGASGDVFVGQTVLPGPDGLPQSCYLMPRDCRNDIPYTGCGIYRHCPPDFCVIKDVTCEIKDSCQSVGICAPGDGNCYYSSLADGTQCDDGLFYTTADTCIGTKCLGIENKCTRYSVKCETANSCLLPTTRVKDSCDPLSGSCVFDAKPDNTLCSSSPGGPLDGGCVAGLCRRPQKRICENVECPYLGFCMERSYCDIMTGLCTREEKAERQLCDDADPTTDFSLCIEGKCVGELVKEAKFHFDGENSCEGVVPAGTQLYYGDVREEEACQEQCKLDPACVAYSYGYYTCYIYGGRGNRTRNPDFEAWQQHWTLLDPLVAPTITYGSRCYSKQDIELKWKLISESAAWFGITVSCLVIVPLLFTLAMTWGPISHSFRVLTGCCSGHRLKEMPADNDGVIDSFQPKSPKGGSYIAQDPGNSLEDNLETMAIREEYASEEDFGQSDPRGQVHEQATWAEGDAEGAVKEAT
ncbi:unnamed protein product [Polarella glacialis]|uniref:Apple domain-containing protein n=1 Tax=Polarella glacialis TaxID=89957 RepID=A0A813KQI1_POLGL|nr:unnamed protein product [Polarella glacialis]